MVCLDIDLAFGCNLPPVQVVAFTQSRQTVRLTSLLVLLCTRTTVFFQLAIQEEQVLFCSH